MLMWRGLFYRLGTFLVSDFNVIVLRSYSREGGAFPVRCLPEQAFVTIVGRKMDREKDGQGEGQGKSVFAQPIAENKSYLLRPTINLHFAL